MSVNPATVIFTNICMVYNPKLKISHMIDEKKFPSSIFNQFFEINQ